MVAYDRLTVDQVVVSMANGWELIRDDLGDWLFSGATWHLLQKDAMLELLDKHLVERYWSRNDPMLESFEEGYRLSAKGRQRAGLVSPFVSVVPDTVRTQHEQRLNIVYFWMAVILVSLCILVHYLCKP